MGWGNTGTVEQNRLTGSNQSYMLQMANGARLTDRLGFDTRVVGRSRRARLVSDGRRDDAQFW